MLPPRNSNSCVQFTAGRRVPRRESDPSRKAYCRFQQGKRAGTVFIFCLNPVRLRNAGSQSNTDFRRLLAIVTEFVGAEQMTGVSSSPYEDHCLR
jgi:hypothetical protein